MIVVTGGSGFIGSEVCRQLYEKGKEARIIDIAPPPLATRAEFVRASVLDCARLERLIKGAESVIHLAALIDVQSSISNPFSDFQVNVQGTLNVLECARRVGVSRVVFASSAAVYGNPVHLPISESHPTAPLSPYGTSKLSAEHFVILYSKLYGMNNTVLRLFNVYGQGQNPLSPYSGVVAKFASALQEGKQPIIYGDGGQTRDFVHVKDAASAFLLAIESEASDTPINIGSGKETKVIELLNKMCEVAGRPCTPQFLPQRKGEIMRSVADISLAKRKIGYYPKVRLEEGLKELLKTKPTSFHQLL